MKYRLLLIFLLLPGPALGAGQQLVDPEAVFPQRLSARDLLYACNASAITQVGRERRRYCAGFISGVEEAARLFPNSLGDGGSSTICLPADVSSRQLADLYTRYAGQHKSLLEQPAAQVAVDALASAYPCPGGDQP
jgi:hypothetical protein